MDQTAEPTKDVLTNVNKSHLTTIDDSPMKNGSQNGLITHEFLEYEPSGWLEQTLNKVGTSTSSFFERNRKEMNVIWIFLLNGIVLGYFFASLYYWINHNNLPLEFCNGFGSLIVLFGIIYCLLVYFHVLKRFFGRWFEGKVWSRVAGGCGAVWEILWVRFVAVLLVLAAIAVYLYIDTRNSPHRLVALIGIFVILLLGFVFSAHPGRVNWRTVGSGLLLQFLFGVLFIRWQTGRAILQCFSDKVATFLSYGLEGSAFVFGDLLVRTEGVFAFSTLPVIFFFSMLVEVLFFWGALQWFCLKLGSLLQAATGTTVCESVIAVSNTFLGMSESILLIKPYAALLTPSEVHTVMASGFSTVSGTILASYIAFGAEPAYLVTASVMAAPGAVSYAKLLMPETRRSLTTVSNIQPVQSTNESALSAASQGASNGINLILNIIANLIAFVAFIAFVNGILGYGGEMVGIEGLNLEWIFGKIFIPVVWMMGVPWEECEKVGSLVGLKTVVNEFVAYQRLGDMKANGELSARAELIATYALCSFSNPSSMGIMIGAVSAMAPNQRETLSSMAWRALYTGCGVCFMTASIAGLLMPEDSLG